MNKKHKFIIGIEVGIVAVVLIVITVFASQPGSTDDPLVAKSYVDDKFERLLDIIDDNSSSVDIDKIADDVFSKISEQNSIDVNKVIEEVLIKVNEQNSVEVNKITEDVLLKVTEQNSANTDKITEDVLTKLEALVSVSNNNNSNSNIQIQQAAYNPVYLEEGQIILGEEGSEFIMRSGNGRAYITGVAGITDITSGREVNDKERISLNHLLVVPRNDGRGIKVSEGTWFLVKGGYKIN